MSRLFNGTTDKIVADAAHLFSEQSAYSVAFWVNAAAPGATAVAFSEGRSSSANPFFLIGCNAANRSKVAVTIRNDAGGSSQINSSGTTQSSATVFDSTWHHVVYAQNASGAWSVYIDGTQDSTLHGTYTTGVTTIDRVGMGCSHRNTDTSFFPGTLAHVAIWSRQLSASDAVILAGGQLPSNLPTGAADHYWALYGVASPEPDYGTASHTDGTLTGTSAGASEPNVNSHTGKAVSPHTGGGAKEANLNRTGTGVSAFTASGDTVVTSPETGGAVAALTGGGVYVRERTKTGSGVSARTGSGYAAPLGHGATAVTRQWQRMVVGSGVWTDIEHATGLNYLVTNADRGHFLRIVEYDYNYLGNASASAATSEPVFIGETGIAVSSFSVFGSNNRYQKTGSALTALVGSGVEQLN